MLLSIEMENLWMSIGIGFLTWHSYKYYENRQNSVSELHVLRILQNKEVSYNRDHMATEKWVWCDHYENFRSSEIENSSLTPLFKNKKVHMR